MFAMKKNEQNKETIQLSFTQLYSALRNMGKQDLNLMLYLLLCDDKISVRDVLSRYDDSKNTLIEKEKCIRLDACNCLNQVLSRRRYAPTKDKTLLLFLKRSIYLIKNHCNIGSIPKIEKLIGYDDKTDLEMKKFIEEMYDIKL